MPEQVGSLYVSSPWLVRVTSCLVGEADLVVCVGLPDLVGEGLDGRHAGVVRGEGAVPPRHGQGALEVVHGQLASSSSSKFRGARVHWASGVRLHADG